MQVLNRKLLRNLGESKGQAIAVIAVILVGVASFVCVLSAHRALSLTQDTYYRRYRFADFWVPLERAPVTAVHKVEALAGVVRAEGRIVKDVNLDVPGKATPCTGRIISLPQRRGTAINDVHLVTGRYFSPEVMNEVILSDGFARKNGLALGDRVWATVNDRKQPLRVIGTALSPEYVYMIRSAREFLPDPERFGILWVKEDFAEMALGMQEACNEIVGFLDPEADADEVLDRLEGALKPYGALTAIPRKDQLSHQYLSGEIEQLGASATYVPSVFLGIAAMILMVMLERIVHRERTQIGVLKACGYSNAAIGGHYIKFGLLLSAVGGAVGILLGQLLARGLMRLYVQFFEFPLLRHRFYPEVLLLSLGISLLAGVAGASWAVLSVLRIQPAEAMRAAAPRAGHRIWLERSTFLWRRVSFIGKMILRDVFRYKVRAGLTVFGVTCAAAILMFGQFARDSMAYLMDYEFDTLQRQDVRVAFQRERGYAGFLEAERFPHVRGAEPELIYPFTLKAAWRTKDVAVTGVCPGARLLNLKTVDGHPIDVGETGLVLTDHLARTLSLQPGDAVLVKPLLGKIERETTVRVRAVAQQFMGTGAYMNIRALSRILGEPFAINAVRLRVERGRAEALNRYLKDVPGVASVEIKADSRRKVEETLAESMVINNVMLGLFAGVIAFAIIYNGTAISLTERTRELASLRVLGFKLSEIRRVVFGENVALSVAGLAAGLPLGALLCRATVAAFETDVYRFPFHLSVTTFVITVLSVAAFVFVANLASRRRINRLDMVEVLKARE